MLNLDKNDNNGLYACNMSEYIEQWQGNFGNTYLMKAKRLSRRQREGVEKVSKLHKSLGYPSTSDMMITIRNETILNCPIIHDDVMRY